MLDMLGAEKCMIVGPVLKRFGVHRLTHEAVARSVAIIADEAHALLPAIMPLLRRIMGFLSSIADFVSCIRRSAVQRNTDE
jgi:hypothetical protein